MTPSPYVFDATADNFSTLVLENSQRGLVLVHFWTPKAGPCMVLMPRLVRLATEYNGRFLLVMLNTDELGSLARRIGVTSVPTVKFYHNGTIVHTIHGAEPDSTFREALGRFITDEPARLYTRGLTAWQHGEVAQAQHLLAQAAIDDPDNPAIARDLAKLLWATGKHQEALTLLNNLPVVMRSNQELEALQTHFLLAHTAETALDAASLEAVIRVNPEDHLARFQLAARYLADEQTEYALESLMAVLSADAGWRDGQARKAMHHLLDWLGPDDPLALHFRQLLANLSH